MHVTIDHSGGIVWETVMPPWWTHGLGCTLENHCHSTQSAAASRNATWNCIMQRGKAFNFAQKCCRVLWALWDEPKNSGNGRWMLHAKEDNPDCSQQKVQKPASVMVWGCISAHSMGDLHICEGTIDPRLMLEFWRDVCCRQDDDFPGTHARTHSARVTTVWLCRHRVHVLDWSACSPDLFPIANVWCIMKRGIRQWGPWTVEQLKSCIHREWAKIPLAKLQQLISSVPKRLQSVIKRNADVTQW